jgi:hypothetical protein
MSSVGNIVTYGFSPQTRVIGAKMAAYKQLEKAAAYYSQNI